MNSNEQITVGQNKQNGPELAQRSGPEKPLGRLSRTHQDYWRSRLVKRTYVWEGKEIELPDWNIRIAHLGKREWFNLQTNNQAAASSKAREIYGFLQANGWEMALAKFKPKAEHKKDMTIEEFSAFYRQTLKRVEYPPSKPSAERYIKSLAFVCGRVGVKKLSDLSSEKVRVFKGKYLETGRAEDRNEESVKISCNATLRYAGALFSRQMLEAYKAAGIVLVNPFADEKLRRVNIKEYSPLRQDVLEAIWKEAAKLRDGDPTETAPERSPTKEGEPRHRWNGFDFRKPHPEAYTILLLELGLGLRRNEADKAQWDWFFTRDGRHYIEIKETHHFKPKSKHRRTIPVEPVLFDAIQATRSEVSPFIVPGRLPGHYSPGKEPKNLVYRCDMHHRALTEWLRNHGVTDAKPCHLLRKEFGSYVATAFGLFHAQKMLGHSSPKVTSDYYAGLTNLPELSHAQHIDAAAKPKIA